MASSLSAPTMAPASNAVPPALFNACFVLLVVNLVFFPAAYWSHIWISNASGHYSVTDFVNVWAAGKLVLDGHPALAYDWDIEKQVELALVKENFIGYLAWHYPPPFLFVAAFLAQFPYAAAFIGWVSVSFLPYLAVMRAIVGRSVGLMLATGFPLVLGNGMVGQNGFLTASLIGGTLYLLPRRPILSGICLGLLTYKPACCFRSC
jgi:Glycosyltransferase family 87